MKNQPLDFYRKGKWKRIKTSLKGKKFRRKIRFDARDLKELADVFQKLAYIEKATLKNHLTLLDYRDIQMVANNQRGFGLTWTRLYRSVIEKLVKIKKHENAAKTLKYFEATFLLQ